MARYQTPSRVKSWQLTNSVIPYVSLWALMIWTLEHLVLAHAAARRCSAAGFLVRIFIIFHDCGHGSFFKSRRANRICGLVTGVLTFTPYHSGVTTHALHHATSGDLDRRGPGDIWTMTVGEYQDASRWRRLAYRLVRNPLVLFLVAPFFSS